MSKLLRPLFYLYVRSKCSKREEREKERAEVEQLVLRVIKLELFCEFFAKEHSFAVAVSETSTLFKNFGCEDYKFLAINIANGRQDLF